MNLHKCILTKNNCYKKGQYIMPKGVMVHSTGANNPNLKRYVGPDDGLLGVNVNNNHWNNPGLNVCVHAFIGKLKDGSIATYQTLPWNMLGWHAGTGTSGRSANSTHISFEICEDALNDATYFKAVYREAVELTAYLCEMYNLDPLADGVVICHSEGCRRGIASNHGDVEHWFSRFGKTMNDFRADVAAEMEDDMTQEKFNEMYANMVKEIQEADGSAWSKEARDWAIKVGLIKGSGDGKYMWRGNVTREQLVEVLMRLVEDVIKK